MNKEELAKLAPTLSEEELELVNRRYKFHARRANRDDLMPPKIEDIISCYIAARNKKFICPYCGDKMHSKNPSVYKKGLSLDHKKALCNDGNNSRRNLIFCCYQCNALKGSMSAKSFKTIVSSLETCVGTKARRRIMSDWAIGRMAKINIHNQKIFSENERTSADEVIEKMMAHQNKEEI